MTIALQCGTGLNLSCFSIDYKKAVYIDLSNFSYYFPTGCALKPLNSWGVASPKRDHAFPTNHGMFRQEEEVNSVPSGIAPRARNSDSIRHDDF